MTLSAVVHTSERTTALRAKQNQEGGDTHG